MLEAKFDDDPLRLIKLIYQFLYFFTVDQLLIS